MRYLKYIFFSLILLFISNNVYANNSYIIVNNDIEEIKEALKTNNNITINLDYDNDELIAKRVVLDLIKGLDKSLVYNILDNNEIIYSYNFNGKYFNKSYNDIDLNVSYSSDKDDYINEYFDINKRIIINTEYSGNYPKGTVLSIKNSIDLKKIYLYKLDDKKFNRMNCVNNNNFLNIEISEGNIYVLSSIELVSMDTIKIYLLIIILLIIELIIFIIIILKKNIDLPKLKT